MSYGRYETFKGKKDSVNPGQAEGAAPGEEQIRVNGFAQVLEMLRVADPTFRETILRNLATRDYTMAQRLRRDLADEGL
jgi:hypothetical protein